MQQEQLRLKRLRDAAIMLHGPEEVQRALDDMAVQIDAVLGDTLPVILCVLTGGIIPAGHILTRLSFPLEIDYLHATRYQGNTSGGDEVHWLCQPRVALTGRTVLVIDDILDEGHTLKTVLDYCRNAGAADVYSAVLIDKRHDRRAGELAADFTGLHVEDRYVFGFGMDYKGYMRNLNGIFTLPEDQD
ncbi:MAG: hypoxanthine-guanine phosphoribosyltransferase [Gammaproteobacteria bacterium]